MRNQIQKLLLTINVDLANKFSKDTIWLISSQFILLVSGFLINLIISVKLGADKLGVFNQILGYYAIFSTIFSLGLNNTLIKTIAEIDQDKILEDKTLSSNLALTAVFSIVFTVILYIVSIRFPYLFSSPELAKEILFLLLALPLFNLNKNYMAYYTGKRNQKLFSMIRSLRWILLMGYVSIALIFTKDLSIILYSFLFTEGILFIFNTLKLWKHFNFKFDLNLIKNNFSFGFKSFSAELLAVFNDKFDILIIGYFLTNSDVGVYSFFIFFAKSLYIFPGIIQQNINPIISKYWTGNKIHELQTNISKIRKINLIVLLLQTLVVLIVYQILILFVKQEFKNSFVFLFITLIGILPSALISWGGSMLVMTGKLKENIYRTLFIMLFSLITTLLFSYYFGLLGASIAVCINSIISFIIMNAFVNKVLGLNLI